jgi:glycosyltransferase involved in cell wall biosynthesis
MVTMKILFFINGLHPGGKERRLLELMRFLRVHDAADMELALMSREMKYPAVYDLGAPIHYLIRRTKKDVGLWGHVMRLCRAVRPDIIHTWDSMTSVYVAPVAKILGTPMVNGMVTRAPSGISVWESEWLRARLTFPLSAAIVGNSRAGLEVYRAPRGKSHCIYNGFDPKRVAVLEDPRDIRAKFSVTTEKVAGMVGEFAERKDFATFVLAAQKLLDGGRDVTFLLVGDGETLEACRALVRKEHAGKIRFLGWQDHVESIVNVMNVGVLATNADVHGEGVSNSILEYMALGKPVVATDTGGTKEIVVDGETGYLVKNRDAAGLALRVGELLDSPSLARSMGERGRARVAEIFSIQRMGEEYLRLYSDLLKKRRN